MRGLIVALLALPLAACGGHRRGDDDVARGLIAAKCGACHTVPGVKSATGRVGPSLAGIARQQVLAGHFPNSRANMIAWLMYPQTMLPGNGMQNTGLTRLQAGLVADYLYTLD